MSYACIVRYGQLQFLSSSPPVNCNSAVIYLADNSWYSIGGKCRINGNAHIKTLDENDEHRVADNTPSTAERPIFDIEMVGQATWRIRSHNSDVVVGANRHIRFSGNTGAAFGNGNNTVINITDD